MKYKVKVIAYNNEDFVTLYFVLQKPEAEKLAVALKLLPHVTKVDIVEVDDTKEK